MAFAKAVSPPAAVIAFSKADMRVLNMTFRNESTLCLTPGRSAPLNFLLMASKRQQVHDSVLPVLAWIKGKGISEAKFIAEHLKISHGRFTNWKRRGVPQGEQARVAGIIGKSTDEYLAEIGRPTGRRPKQGKLDTRAYMEDFEGLPDFLQMLVVRRTAALRKMYEGMPQWLRDRLVPPKDPGQYGAWEKEIEALMLKFRGRGEDD